MCKKEKYHTYYDLLQVNMITNKETLFNEMQKARKNIETLNDYLVDCSHKLAEMSKNKLFKCKVYYEVDVEDYYVAKSKENVEIGPEAIHWQVVEYINGDYDTENLEELADYTEKDNENI